MKLAVWIMAAILWVASVSAYEVWMGTHLATHAMATNLSAWSTVAPQLEGYNVNRAPHDTDPASNDDYRTIFAQFTKANSTGHVMSEVARSEVTRNPDNVDSNAFPYIDDRLSIIFGFENTFNYDLDILMFYDERGTYQGTEYLYEWTDIEVQYMRDWMDANGHADVELMWNVRNNSVRNQYYGAHPLVDLIQIEASTTAFLGNTNNQRTYLNWFWTNPATINKEVILQIPRALPGDPYNQYEGTRRLAVLLGAELGYGVDGVRSDRLVFEPVTYNDNYPYLPETTSGGTAYANHLTSICLSLIEQRPLFEGRTRLPTHADADSTTRLFAPIVSPIADQILQANTSTGPLAFTIDDDLTAPSALALTASSSDTNLVPLANIVFGGSDSNRTVTITPVPGLSGSVDISIFVSDGTLGTTETFEVSVLPPGTIAGTIYSDGADCSIKENPAIEKLTDATVDLGARGSAPWVERCTVYVFPLPDLGAVSNPFTDAAFTFNYVSKNATIRGHDLYGLGLRASSAALTSDFYAQSSTADPTDATRLQQSILTDSTPLGLVSTAGSGTTNLVAYLNAQYAGGAGIGQSVFLRLNTRAPKSGISYATLTMSEGGVAGLQDTRPRITYRAVGNSPPYMSVIADQSILASTNTGPLPFIVGDDAAPGLITLAGGSSNTKLVPVANIVFGGSDSNRTVTVTPAVGQVGTAEISIIASDGALGGTNSFTLTVEPPPPPPPEVIAGWDTWNSGSAPTASVLAPDITGTAVTTTEGLSWHANDGRGASADGDWGTFTSSPAASTVAGDGVTGENLELPNATTGGTITFTITNHGALDILLDAFHFDAYAFRPKAARAYELSVLPGGGIADGVIYTSVDDEITHVGGAWDNLAHDDIDHDVTGLADHTLGAGESVQFLLAFSSGEGDESGGHDLWVDNVALTGSILPATEPPVLEHTMSGNDLVFTWTSGGFALQTSTNLTVGNWSDVPGGAVSPVLVLLTDPAAFFRLTEQ